jgi:hypothetical protein
MALFCMRAQWQTCIAEFESSLFMPNFAFRISSVTSATELASRVTPILTDKNLPVRRSLWARVQHPCCPNVIEELEIDSSHLAQCPLIGFSVTFQL